MSCMCVLHAAWIAITPSVPRTVRVLSVLQPFSNVAAAEVACSVYCGHACLPYFIFRLRYRLTSKQATANKAYRKQSIKDELF